MDNMLQESESGYALYHGDCLEIMKGIPDGSVDCVLCDLPYGVTKNPWDSLIPLDALWSEYRRVSKKNAPSVLFSAQPFTSILVCSNLRDFKYEWSWNKSRFTGVLNAKKMPCRRHENILVFYKPPCLYNPQGLVAKGTYKRQGGSSDNYSPRKLDDYIQEFTGYPRDVLEFKSEGKTIHPTQKPVPLLEYLIRTYTNEGDTVLDSCFGSCATGIACLNTGRKFIGIEMDDRYFALGSERMRNHDATR